MRRKIATPDFHGPEPTPKQLAERKRISDRAVLLDHIDHIIRPPFSALKQVGDDVAAAVSR